jgi:hypothetical protein
MGNLRKGGKIEEWTMGGWEILGLFELKFFSWIFENRSPKWHMDESSCSKPKYEDKMPYRAFWIQSDHLRVISGEPSERRNFLDDMLTFASPGYDRKSCETIAQHSPLAIVWFNPFSTKKRENETSHRGILSSQNTLSRLLANEEIFHLVQFSVILGRLSASEASRRRPGDPGESFTMKWFL